MPNWGDNVHWNSGARWWVPTPERITRRMSIIAINTAKLPLADKLGRGQEIITKSTSNPDVPGNAAVLAAFVTAQDALTGAMNDEVAARSAVTQKVTVRQDALVEWTTTLNALAGFTGSATGGEAAAIESAGFGVRAPRTPPQPLPAPEGLVAKTNGTPGHTLLSWPPLAGAKSYIVQISPDPMTAASWSFARTCTTASADVNGAEAGKRYWYRVAGVNGKGQGPWSEPACRPVI